MPGRSRDPDRFFTADEQARVAAAIAEAESRTSAEIRLALSRHAWLGVEARARQLFVHHGLDRTAERNGVLVLLVTSERRFHILGDEGIHAKVGQGFWDDVRDAMAQRFRADAFAEGLCDGIARIGDKLAEHFPHRADDVNELPNDVICDDT